MKTIRLFFFILCYFPLQILAQYDYTPFVTSKGKCGYKKTMPNVLLTDDKAIPPRFCDCGDFRDEVAAVAIQKKHQLKYGLINKKGKNILAFEYDLVVVGSWGRILVQKQGKWGIVNPLGKILVACEYDSIILAKNIVLVEKNHQWQTLKSQEVYDEILSLSDTLPIVITQKEGLWGLLGRTSCKYDSLIYEYRSEYIILTRQNESILYDMIKDSIIFPPFTPYLYKFRMPIQKDKYHNNIPTIFLSAKKDTIYYPFHHMNMDNRDFFYGYLQAHYTSSYKKHYPVRYYTKLTILTHLFNERSYFMIYPSNVVYRKNEQASFIGIVDTFAKEILPLRRYKDFHYLKESFVYYRSPHHLYGYVLDLNTRKIVQRMTRREYKKQYEHTNTNRQQNPHTNPRLRPYQCRRNARLPSSL